tara:strand:- start:64 stop:729 length:666 start_codon:yes stop_codon:yes gene_type:complete
MRLIHWVAQSNDKKTGKVIVSYSPKETCPDSCSLKEGGCYAWGLFYLNKLGKDIANGARELRSLQKAFKDRRADCKIVRHRVAGDIVGDVEGTLEECSFVEQAGLINVGYTHAWREEASQPLKKFFRASCQSIEEVFEARRMGWGASLIVNDGVPKVMTLSNGEKAIKCPARYGVAGKQDITCNTCTLCKVTDKTINKTIMFEIHGNRATLNKAQGKFQEV